MFKNKLDKCEIELQSKEDQLENARSMLKYSENRMIKIEEFVNSQKQRITSLEEKLQESEQVCSKVIYYLFITIFSFSFDRIRLTLPRS